MDYYAKIRKQFEDAGLRIYLYNVNFNETFTDEERDRTFEAAVALGAAGFSSSTVISEARRLVPFVERHKMFVAMHNHNNLVDPDQFATPGSFETALAMSPYFKTTLDIGHFVAGNNDPRWTFENRQFVDRPKPAISGAAETSEFYFVPSSARKSVCTFVRQLRGPHLSTWA